MSATLLELGLATIDGATLGQVLHDGERLELVAGDGEVLVTHRRTGDDRADVLAFAREVALLEAAATWTTWCPSRVWAWA